ncbi:hypothetical protein [Streptomyces griseoaurantiacus]|uniref:hypothetical protein n=1 Tax=Streptomyces griseoaurantiacus TaxID=68213 RepID=UPI0036A3FF8A
MANVDKVVEQLEFLIKASENYTRNQTRHLLEDAEDAVVLTAANTMSRVVGG